MPLINKILFFLAIFASASSYCQEPIKSNVLVTYAKINPDKISGQKYVILESEHFNAFDIKRIKVKNQLVLGYLSVGEVNPHRSYYHLIKEKTKGKNKIWDSYYLDLSDETTTSVMIGLVDKIVQKGFNGLFLDTVDAFGNWGPLKSDSTKYFDFLKLIKTKYPELHLMQNSGISILKGSAKYINSVALESVFTDYNFKESSYRLRKEKGIQERLHLVGDAHSSYNLPFVLIEYAVTKAMVKKVRERLIPLTYDYFIGNIELSAN